MKTFLLYTLFDVGALFFFSLYEKSMKKFIRSKKKSDNSSINKKIKNYQIYLVISFVILFVLLGFRDINVGKDTKTYASLFYRIVDNNITLNDKNWIGYGYLLIGKLIGFVFGKNYIVLNCFVGFFSLYFIYKAIIENSEKKTLSLYIFLTTCLYYQMLNQSRQLLAISIILYSTKYIRIKNKKKYLFWCVFASLIHASAIVMIPFYFIFNRRVTTKNLLKYLSLGIVMFAGYSYIEKLLLMTSYGKIYIATNYYDTSISSIINFIFRSMLLGFILLFRNKNNEKNLVYINSAIWCTLLSAITIKLYIFGRITTYFYIMYILTIPNIINERKKDKYLIEFIIVIGFFIYHILYYNIMAENAGYDIYNFFW